MIRYLLSIVTIFLFANPTFGQQPVAWRVTVTPVGNDVCEIHIKGQIEKGWHTFSGKQPKGAVPSPTRIDLSKNPLVKLLGEIIEKGDMEKHITQPLGLPDYRYAGKVEFIQQVQVRHGIKTNIKVTVTYQACTEEKCLPVQTVSFDVKI